LKVTVPRVTPSRPASSERASMSTTGLSQVPDARTVAARFPEPLRPALARRGPTWAARRLTLPSTAWLPRSTLPDAEASAVRVLALRVSKASLSPPKVTFPSALTSSRSSTGPAVTPEPRA